LRYLLDTHALLWWWTDDARLSAHARSLIADEANEIFVSAASAWEIATKYRLGKLPQAGAAMVRSNPDFPLDRPMPSATLHLSLGCMPSVAASRPTRASLAPDRPARALLLGEVSNLACDRRAQSDSIMGFAPSRVLMENLGSTN
jgi:hypothetical protein